MMKLPQGSWAPINRLLIQGSFRGTGGPVQLLELLGVLIMGPSGLILRSLNKLNYP